MLATIIVAGWLAAVGACLLIHRHRLLADWREPVLAVPVLIIESDDWGPGPVGDGERLRQLIDLLRTRRDRHGNPAVMTLGVVLAVPDGTRTSEPDATPRYAPQTLDAAEFAGLRAAMLTGRGEGVFALQLHGHEHFWPPALERAAESEPTARAFLASSAGSVRHESLPAPLQARWVDASRLPSTDLQDGDIERAVADETTAFERIFGARAAVAVPVTFVWTTKVEAQWARRGIRVVVTPGTRNIGRDGNGRLVSDGSIIRNGDVGPGGVVYLVRDVYFEPALGHTAATTVAAVQARFRLGRPALLETHRFNFTGAENEARRSLDQMKALLDAVQQECPQLRFMTTEALAMGLAVRSEGLVDRRTGARIRAFVLRAGEHSRLRKLAWASGLALPAAMALWLSSWLLQRATRRAVHP